MDLSLKLVMSIVVLISAALVLTFIVNSQYSGAENYISSVVNFP